MSVSVRGTIQYQQSEREEKQTGPDDERQREERNRRTEQPSRTRRWQPYERPVAEGCQSCADRRHRRLEQARYAIFVHEDLIIRRFKSC